MSISSVLGGLYSWVDYNFAYGYLPWGSPNIGSIISNGSGTDIQNVPSQTSSFGSTLTGISYGMNIAVIGGIALLLFLKK